jgi:hypothetical protein
LIPAVSATVQLDVVLLAVAALHLLDVAEVTSLLARMTAGTVTETTIVETEATAPAVLMTGTVISRTSETVIVRKFERTAPTAKIGKLPWILLLLRTMN